MCCSMKLGAAVELSVGGRVKALRGLIRGLMKERRTNTADVLGRIRPFEICHGGVYVLRVAIIGPDLLR